MSIVEVNNLCYCASEWQTVCDVSFAVDTGETFALVGTEKSGKTAIARHLNGLLLPKSGRVSVCGLDTSDNSNLKDIRKKCGMIFPDSRRHFLTSSVEDEMSLALKCAGVSDEDIPGKTEACLSIVGMNGRGKERPDFLTEYECLCVQIATVLAYEPEVLVFADAASEIYGEDRESYFAMLRKLHDDGKTVIIFTNSCDEASLAQRVLLLKDGKTLICGETRDVLSDMKSLGEAGIEPSFPMRAYHDLLESDIKLGRPPLSIRELVDEICL